MVATFSGCAMVTHWLPHTLVQIFYTNFDHLYKKNSYEYVLFKK